MDEENCEDSDEEKDDSYFTLNEMHDNVHILHVDINDNVIIASTCPNSKSEYLKSELHKCATIDIIKEGKDRIISKNEMILHLESIDIFNEVKSFFSVSIIFFSLKT